MASAPRVESLTGLRFFLAFFVFLSHVMKYFFGESYGIWDGLGTLGVSMFFVLSGFVLFINYIDPHEMKAIDFKGFYIARVARIYPAFLATLILAIPLELGSWSKPLFWESLALNVTMMHSFFSESVFSFNNVGWTIGVEVLFYALFPFIASALFMTARPLRTVMIAALCWFLLWVCVQTWLPDSYFATQFYPLNRLMEFVGGMVTGYVFLRYPAMLPNVLARPKYVGLLAFSVLALLVVMPLGLPRLPNMLFLLYLLPTMLLYYLLAVAEFRSRVRIPLLCTGWMVLGGEISYAFYLAHNLILRYARNAMDAFLPQHFMLPVYHDLRVMVSVLSLMLTLGTAYGIYRWVEAPMRQWLRLALKSLFSGAGLVKSPERVDV